MPTQSFTAIIEKCNQTGLYIAHVPGISGAHTQARTLDELKSNLEEVLSLILEDHRCIPQSEFIGTQTITLHV
ncbi:MAG: type II toxin-antitoxin system HicB family antitoxin [Deltaproteobacteria bacterium]|nr:type II toxin-antitoxin system HicB family antitoxin [Deltaproteobacteria bacterium]